MVKKFVPIVAITNWGKLEHVCLSDRNRMEAFSEKEKDTQVCGGSVSFSCLDMGNLFVKIL